MTIPKVGITGASGFIGQSLLKYPNCFSLVGDVTNPSEIEMAIKSSKPDLVVHLASVSDVDYCEKDENVHHVHDVNIRGTMNVAEATENYNIPIVLMSTAQIFSGNLMWGTYREWHTPNPKNRYGVSKVGAEGMQDLFPHMKIVRTSYLFNKARIEKYVEQVRKGHSVEFPTFIKRSFLHLEHFTIQLAQYLDNFDSMPNVLHLSGSESISWHDFMVCVARELGLNAKKILPRTKEIDHLYEIAPRPHQGGLNVGLARKLGFPMYSYYDGALRLKHE